MRSTLALTGVILALTGCSNPEPQAAAPSPSPSTVQPYTPPAQQTPSPTPPAVSCDDYSASFGLGEPGAVKKIDPNEWISQTYAEIVRDAGGSMDPAAMTEGQRFQTQLHIQGLKIDLLQACDTPANRSTDAKRAAAVLYHSDVKKYAPVTK